MSSALSWSDFFPNTPLEVALLRILPVAVAAPGLVQFCDPRSIAVLRVSSSRSFSAITIAEKTHARKQLLIHQRKAIVAVIKKKDRAEFQALADVLAAPGGLQGWAGPDDLD